VVKSILYEGTIALGTSMDSRKYDIWWQQLMIFLGIILPNFSYLARWGIPVWYLSGRKWRWYDFYPSHTVPLRAVVAAELIEMSVGGGVQTRATQTSVQERVYLLEKNTKTHSITKQWKYYIRAGCQKGHSPSCWPPMIGLHNVLHLTHIYIYIEGT